MKLVLSKDGTRVKSWQCAYVDNGYYAPNGKENGADIELKKVYNFKGSIEKRPLGYCLVFAVLFAIAAIVSLLVFNFAMTDMSLVGALVAIVCIIVAFVFMVVYLKIRPRVFFLTLYMQDEREDLVGIYLDRNETEFSYLNSYRVTFEIDVADANSVVSKLGSLLAKYDPNKKTETPAEDAQQTLPQKLGMNIYNGFAQIYPFPTFNQPTMANLNATQVATPVENPYVLFVENEAEKTIS